MEGVEEEGRRRRRVMKRDVTGNKDIAGNRTLIQTNSDRRDLGSLVSVV